LHANIAALGAGTAAVVHRGDALRFAQALPAATYDVAFADPPYRLGLATGVAKRWLEVPFAALLGVEHEAGERLPGPGDTRRYGTTAITFYRWDEEGATEKEMDDS
jgi:16S rRNA (guanine966-N2)-methyltransferase